MIIDHCLRVNARAIGEGIYEMICDADEDAIVAFGMIPLWAIEVLEKELTEKVIQEAAKQVDCTVDEIKPFIDEKKVKELVQKISREVSTEIYGAASRANKTVC